MVIGVQSLCCLVTGGRQREGRSHVCQGQLRGGGTKSGRSTAGSSPIFESVSSPASEVQGGHGGTKVGVNSLTPFILAARLNCS